MAHKKQGGKLTQRVRPEPKYLGLKVSDGQKVTTGSILVRQRGTPFTSGEGVKIGRDHTLFAVKPGTVKFGSKMGKKIISIH
ncbi:MAG: 50S ribosomal protein L27 [Candidatus Woesebacteria bacterium GW2011_GWB1_39_12]|uniref:Large ribosomal subunit protein bL27 n=2 Tax=Candidatus Woeseibacteriota TaxID=1752722 RepID=A0A0G0PI35_9BACT|nr:MAG: 50S ribosomal protein L27 [Candidatus Woesebacteria bacterium GW2011_GWA1_39_12]KKR00449.1 MAG: 50S ribosomal protein L27 [Candidatus Woesebacteria bacterium GW2011_GWB1_39_12]